MTLSSRLQVALTLTAHCVFRDRRVFNGRIGIRNEVGKSRCTVLGQHCRFGRGVASHLLIAQQIMRTAILFSWLFLWCTTGLGAQAGVGNETQGTTVGAPLRYTLRP